MQRMFQENNRTTCAWSILSLFFDMVYDQKTRLKEFFEDLVVKLQSKREISILFGLTSHQSWTEYYRIGQANKKTLSNLQSVAIIAVKEACSRISEEIIKTTSIAHAQTEKL